MKYHLDRHTDILLSEAPEATKRGQIDDMADQFKALGETYAVNTDPSRRRIYDSTDEFDDEIPTDSAPEDFFEVFSPAFMRNSRWSINQPIPLLGDEKTPMKEVDKFYDLWYAFKSWRGFPHADEFDLEQADSRDHKRWMERQNAKLTEKARKEEYNRVRTLVDNAYKRDPRILKRKEEEKAEKQRRKETKYLMKKMKEKEDAKAADEERVRKEEEEKRAAEVASQQKKHKEKEKKLARKERSCRRTLAAPLLDLLDISSDDVERLCVSLVGGSPTLVDLADIATPLARGLSESVTSEVVPLVDQGTSDETVKGRSDTLTEASEPSPVIGENQQVMEVALSKAHDDSDDLEKIERGVTFPTCISVINTVCHFSPLASDCP
ncbi:hypothetical protein Droror1_Dr00012666 [Drosera rotundifolia]